MGQALGMLLVKSRHVMPQSRDVINGRTDKKKSVAAVMRVGQRPELTAASVPVMLESPIKVGSRYEGRQPATWIGKSGEWVRGGGSLGLADHSLEDLSDHHHCIHVEP